MEKKKTCFVISKIEEDANHYSNIFYEGIVEEALKDTFDIKRADKIHSAGNIWGDILENLENSDLVIADLTDLNPNVFYELGIRTHIGKPIIQFIQDITQLPFDLKQIRTIQYGLGYSALKKAKNNLRKFIEKINFQ